MSIDKRKDPALAFNFTITLMESASSTGDAVTKIALNTLTDHMDAGFTECSGLEPCSARGFRDSAGSTPTRT